MSMADGAVQPATSVADGGRANSTLEPIVASLMEFQPPLRALVVAASTTVLFVLLELVGSGNISLGVARALPLVGVSAVMAAATERALPGLAVNRRVVMATTAGSAVVVVVIHRFIDVWGAGAFVLSALSALAYGLVACSPLLSARKWPPLVSVSMFGGLGVGILGEMLLNAGVVPYFGVWRLRLPLVLSAVFICAFPVAIAVLAWASADRLPRSSPASGSYGQDAGIGVTAPTGSNGLAVGALVCGLLGVSIPAIVLGHIALSQIKASGGRQGGRGMALAGLVLGYVALVIVVVVFVLLGVFAASLDNGY
jgi:hypothetical protein